MEYEVVATVSSPFKQKFAIPRQPNLVKEATGSLIFTEAFSDPQLIRRLEDFSHLWLIFQFHAVVEHGWTPTVQPPRLGGKEKVGVFASRSPFRPNSLGLSVVENLGSYQEQGRLIIKVGGLDLLDGTPVLDIKPYLPYADSIPEASAGYAQEQPQEKFEVSMTATALDRVRKEEGRYPGLEALILSLLRQDPRPAWRVKTLDEKQYGMALYDLNIKWQIDGQRITVVSVETVEEPDLDHSIGT